MNQSFRLFRTIYYCSTLPFWRRLYRRYLFLRVEQVFPKRSYSQYGEDIIVQKILGQVSSIVDIGANDGVSASNSFKFVLSGARALLFEPIPQIYRFLADVTHGAARAVAINEGISDVESNLEFAVAGSLSFALSTEDKTHSAGCQILAANPATTVVKVRPLSYHLVRHPEFAKADCLSCDVEGHELNVLRGIDFRDFQPRVVVIETHGPSPAGFWLHRDYEQVRAILIANGYEYALSTIGNSFWVRAGDPAAQSIDGVLRNSIDTFAGEPPTLGDEIQNKWRKQRSRH